MMIDENFTLEIKFTRDGQGMHDALLRDVRKHNAAVEAYGHDAEKLRQEVAANWTAKRESDVSKLHERRAALLTAELGLRERLAAWIERVRHFELSAEATAASDDAVAAEAKVRAGLLALGYVDDEYGRVFSMLVRHHPAIIRALGRLNAAQGSSFPAMRGNENAAAIAKTSAELEALKRQALAALGV